MSAVFFSHFKGRWRLTWWTQMLHLSQNTISLLSSPSGDWQTSHTTSSSYSMPNPSSVSMACVMFSWQQRSNSSITRSMVISSSGGIAGEKIYMNKDVLIYRYYKVTLFVDALLHFWLDNMIRLQWWKKNKSASCRRVWVLSSSISLQFKHQYFSVGWVNALFVWLLICNYTYIFHPSKSRQKTQNAQ